MTSLLVIFQNNYQVYLKILKFDLDWATTAATYTQKSHGLVSADFIELALGKKYGQPLYLACMPCMTGAAEVAQSRLVGNHCIDFECNFS